MAVKVVTVGSETQVNVIAAVDQMYSAVSGLADGGWIVTWQSQAHDGSGQGIFQRRYNAQGATTGPDILVNGTTANDQIFPSVTGLSDGGWVVTWQSNLQDGSKYGVYQRVYNAQGVTTGADILVNATTADEQQNPSVTALKDGGWVVTWQSGLQDGSGYGVYQRVYNAQGVTAGADILVNVTTASDQQNPSVATLSNGGWVVTWQSNLQDGSGQGIFQRRYDAQGVTTGPDILVNATTNLSQINPSVTGLSGGGWVATWQSNLQDGSGYGVYQRVYNAQGVTAGADILVNVTTASDQQNASVTALRDGGWVVTWQSGLQDGSGYGVYQRYYTASGSTVGPDILVNTATGSDQSNPTITALANGGWVVSWMSHLQDGSGWGVYQRQYSPNGGQILTGSTEIATGTAADETLSVQLGSLNAGDQLIGGAGLDTLQMLSSGTIDLTAPALLSGFEAVVGAGGNDTFIMNASRFGGFTSFDGGAGTDILQFMGGGSYDTRGKTLTGIDKIVLTGGGAAVTVDNVATALLLRGSVEDHNSVNFAGGIFTAIERQQLFRQGIETISDSSGIYTNEPPSLNELNGDNVTVTDGDTVLIDRDGDATVVDNMGSLRFLEVLVSKNGIPSEDRFGISTASGISLSAGVTTGSLISVNGTTIGTITSSGSDLQIAFNGNATGALIQQLVRSLTYTNINEVNPAATPRTISITLTDSTGAWTTATTAVTVEQANDAPTVMGVEGTSQSFGDDALINPFSNVSIADVDSPILTVTVVLDDPAKGALLNLSGGTYNTQAGTYTLTGSASEVTVALNALRFDPRDRFEVGSQETTTFTISISDGVNPAVVQTTSVTTVASNRAPTAITLSGTKIDEHAGSGTVIGILGAVDPNPSQSFTYALLDIAGGRFAIQDEKLVLANSGLLEATQSKAYTIQVKVTDSAGASYIQDFTITVDAQDDAPTLKDILPTGQSVADDNVLSPFSTVTISDVDSPTLTLTVTLDNPAKGVLLNLGDGSFDATSGTYTINGSATQLTAALHALQFNPQDRPTEFGQVETTTFTISVSDSANPIVAETVSVTSVVSNRAPTAVTLSNSSIDEHVVNGAVIGTLGAVDPNEGQGFTHTLLDDAGGRFAIQDGKLIVANVHLLEATRTKTYTIQVKVTDAGGASHEDILDVTVNAQNDEPTLTGVPQGNQTGADNQALSPFSGVTVADMDSPILTLSIRLDNPANGTLLGLSGGAYDPQTGTYTLTGSASELTTALQNLRFDPRDRSDAAGSVETTILTLHVTDEGGQDVSQAVLVDAITSNRAPTAITLSGTTIDEHASAGVVIGTLGALDPNGSEGLNYTLLNDAGGRFALVNGNLVVADPKLLEASATAQYQIWLHVTDPAGASHTQGFLIAVTAQNDAPTLTGMPSTAQMVEDTNILSPFSAVTVMDADSPTLTVTVTLDDPAKGVLQNLSGGSYNEQTGTYIYTGSAAQITSALRALQFDPLDRPTALGLNEETTFTVSVQDGSGSDVSQTCTVVSAVSNRAPTAINLTGTSTHEHAIKGAVIGTLSATDPNGDQGLIYKLLDNAEGRFAIVDGKLIVLNPQLLTAEETKVYPIQVKVTDAEGASYVQDFNITVNIDTAPVAASSGNAASGDEDTVIQGSVPAGLDADGDTLTYQLVGNAVVGLTFHEDGTFTYTPAANLHGAVTFQYQVVDSHGERSQPQTFTLTIHSVNDTPVAASSGNSASGHEGTTISGKVPNGSDVEGDTLSYRLVTSVEGLALNDDGSFTYQAAADFSGEVTFQYQVEDSYGATSNQQTFTLTILDTTAPEDAAITIAGEEHGLNATEATGAVAVTIAPDEGAHVVSAKIGHMDLVRTDTGYSFDATKLRDGEYIMTVVTADNAGNQTTTTKTVVLETTGPEVQSISLDDTYLKIGDTANVRVTFSEAVTGFDRSDVTVAHGTLGDFSTNDGGKTWTATFTPAAGIDAAATVVNVLTGYADLAGNAGASGTSANVQIDTKAPAKPDVALLDDTGTLDSITRNGTLKISGLENGATVEYSINGMDWSDKFSAAEGQNTVYVRQIDAAGNASEASDAFTFILDTKVPDAVQITFTKRGFNVESGATVNVTVDGAIGDLSKFTRNTLGGQDIYTANVGAFTGSEHISISVTQADAAGNISASATLAGLSFDTSAPVITSAASQALVENAAGTHAPVVVAALGANEAATFRIKGGADAELFKIVDGSLVYAGGALDFETAAKRSFMVEIEARDAANNTMHQTVTVNLTDVNEAPVSSVDGNSASTAEGKPILNGHVPIASDPDQGDSLKYVLVGNSVTGLTLKENGSFTYEPPLNFKGEVKFRYKAVDSHGLETAEQTFILTVADITAPAKLSVALLEDTGLNDGITARGELTINGLEAGASIQYSANGVNWNNTFSPKEGLNKVYVRQIDEAGNTSQASDVLTFTFDTTAPSNVSLSRAEVLENAAAGTVVGTLSATDADAGGLTYSLAPNSDADGRFTLVTLKGVTALVVKDGVKLDYEQATAHPVTIRVTDAAGNSSTKVLTIAVNDVANEKAIGSSSFDVLRGGRGHDKLSGGYGNDVLWGGAGRDAFVFDTKLGTSATDRKVNFDTIKDFNVRDDSIQLDNAIFRKLVKVGKLNKDFFHIGSKAMDKDDYILYHKGVLSYDADGSGTKSKAVEFAWVGTKKGFSAADLFVI